MPLYLKVWSWLNKAEITDNLQSLLTLHILQYWLDPVWLHTFLPVLYTVILLALHRIVCINICHLSLTVSLHLSLLTLPPTSVLESSCQTKGRGAPGRQHQHSTPLVNRPQKINPAFQPQQQQPIGFGQVSTCRDMYTRKHTQLFIFDWLNSIGVMCSQIS